MLKVMNIIEQNQRRLNDARGYSEVWQIVKDNVSVVLRKHRRRMMLFLDDLPLRLGAYHPLGTNNIVLNRALTQIVKATTKSQKLLNAFIYTLLLHEYIHALGYVREAEVRPLVHKVTKNCLGQDHVATRLAKLGPWSLLRRLPLDALKVQKRVMEIVKNFETTDEKYII